MTYHLGSYFHPWFSLIFACALEVTGTVNAKSSRGLTVFGPTVTMFVCYIFSVAFLSFALDYSVHQTKIDLGIAYATWSGLGTIAAAVAGVYLYGEKLIATQYFGILLTIAGLIIINMAPSFVGRDGKHSSVERLLMGGDDTTRSVMGRNNTTNIGTYGAV